MTEADRKKVISEIQKELEEKESLSTKYEELKRLTENSIVVKYLQLLEEINRIERDINRYKSPINGSINDSLEKRIRFWFRVGRFSCNHNVWLYAGSYYSYINFKNEMDYMRYDLEDTDSFSTFDHNKYVCLECREEVKIPKSEWERFEDSHLILKTKGHIDIEHYQDLYYQLLYHNYDFGDAQQAVIDEFNKDNKQKNKTLLN